MYAIPPGQEDAFLALVSPRAGGSCRLDRASLEIDHAEAVYVCDSQTLRATFRHASAVSGSSHQLGDFSVSFERSPPPELLAALRASLDAKVGSWRWVERDSTPSPSRSGALVAEPEAIAPAPISRTQQVEAAISFLCLLALIATLARARRPRRELLVAGALAAVAFAFRLAIPAVPANFYTDFDPRIANYRYDFAHHAPVQLLLSSLHLAPTGIFAADILLGALVVPLLYLGLRAVGGRGSSRLAVLDPTRVALPMSALVAVWPAYARIAASDAPHVVGLFWLVASLVFLGRALAGRGVVAWVGLVLSCWLVGAARRELAPGPVLIAALSLVAGASLRRRLVGAAASLVGGLLGAFLTPLALWGRPNVAVEISMGNLRAYVRAFGTALGTTFEGAPLLLRVGVALLAAVLVFERRLDVLLAYPILLASQTCIYAATPFGSAMDHPLESWALARYAQVWLLVPAYFAAAGLVDALARLPRRRWLTESALLASTLLANSELGSLRDLHAYQREYLFLRRALPAQPSGLPLVAIWQKNAGIDYCESLALPHFGITALAPARETVVVPTTRALGEVLDQLPPRFLYFHGALAQVDLGALGALPPETSASLRRVKASDCALRGGTVVAAELGVPVRFIQLPLEHGPRMDLELRIVDRESVRAALGRCAVW